MSEWIKRSSWFLMIVPLFVNSMMMSCTGNEKNEHVWGNLKNMGPNINSSGKDEHVTFTQDGETMYFASIREGGRGGYDIYRSMFENGEWSKAELLPSPINTEKDDFDVFVTLDGKKLFFASNRDSEGPYWDCDIYVSDWQGDGWGEPRIFDSTFVTPGKPDWGVAFPRDFKTFIFSSGKEPAKKGLVQIFQSIWLGDCWSKPQALPEPVNTGGWEATPYVTPDGKNLYLNSGRGREDKKDVDIWKFEFANGEWTNAELMDGPFRSNEHDYDPCLSPDGKYFYFTSNRDGGFGDSDIWVVEKIHEKPPKYSTFLRETAHLDFTHPVFTEVLSEVTSDDMSLEQKLEALFYFTRDSISFVADASLYASEALGKRKAVCYTKAMIFVSFCRRLGVPARLARIEFLFPKKSRHSSHGIAKIFYEGKWIYIDTVSNQESWMIWDKNNADIFRAPRFSLDHDVTVDPPYVDDIILGDYETNDVPIAWLESMREFLETGSW